MTGDIVTLLEGMEVPADGYIIEIIGENLMVDESNFSGETDPIKKSDLINCLKIRDEIIYEGNRNTC